MQKRSYLLDGYVRNDNVIGALKEDCLLVRHSMSAWNGKVHFINRFSPGKKLRVYQCYSPKQLDELNHALNEGRKYLLANSQVWTGGWRIMAVSKYDALKKVLETCRITLEQCVEQLLEGGGYNAMEVEVLKQTTKEIVCLDFPTKQEILDSTRFECYVNIVNIPTLDQIRKG